MSGPDMGDDPGTTQSRGVRLRSLLKRGLALGGTPSSRGGATLLIYHRVGAGTSNELDLPLASFAQQVDLLQEHDVVSLDVALDRLDAGDMRRSVVLTFDDGFEDVYLHAWPLLRERRLPFTVYLASGYVSQPMVWEGSTSRGSAGRGMSWAQLEEMVDSGLCTVGNHTHHHVRPEHLDSWQLDECSDAVLRHLGVPPRHFTYPWGIAVPRMEEELRSRFRSASTGELGRNRADTDRMQLMRVPVRQSDPIEFFASKLAGSLFPERVYADLVRLGKGIGLRA